MARCLSTGGAFTPLMNAQAVLTGAGADSRGCEQARGEWSSSPGEGEMPQRPEVRLDRVRPGRVRRREAQLDLVPPVL